jgi:hypothetical protein
MGLEYAVFTVPAESEAEMVNAGATTIERASDLVCAGMDESVTVKVGLVGPLAVGVPEMTPVLESRLRPVRRALLAQL